MAQKPVIPQSRKPVERAKKPAAKDTVKKLDKAVGARGSTLGTIDTLVNKHLASFRNAEKTLAEARALVQSYVEKYPELADYLPKDAVQRGIYTRESKTDESEGSHKFYIRLGAERYEVAGADQHDYEQVTAAPWTQRFKEQLAVSIAKIVFAREAGEVPK